jgi:hypothetical protein
MWSCSAEAPSGAPEIQLRICSSAGIVSPPISPCSGPARSFSPILGCLHECRALGVMNVLLRHWLRVYPAVASYTLTRTFTSTSLEMKMGRTSPTSVKVLWRRYHCLHLVRIGAFHSVRLDGCSHVVIGLSGLNRAVAVIHRWVQCWIYFPKRPSARGRAVDVVSGDRRRCARIPG